jgi:hypothetical protein
VEESGHQDFRLGLTAARGRRGQEQPPPTAG